MDPDGMLRDLRRERDEDIYGGGGEDYNPKLKDDIRYLFSKIRSFFSKLFSKKKQ